MTEPKTLHVRLTAALQHPLGTAPLTDCCNGSTVQNLYPLGVAKDKHDALHAAQATAILAAPTMMGVEMEVEGITADLIRENQRSAEAEADADALAKYVRHFDRCAVERATGPCDCGAVEASAAHRARATSGVSCRKEVTG